MNMRPLTDYMHKTEWGEEVVLNGVELTIGGYTIAVLHNDSGFVYADVYDESVDKLLVVVEGDEGVASVKTP